jgi:hypothetical protein
MTKKRVFILLGLGRLPAGYGDVRLAEAIGFIVAGYIGYFWFPPSNHFFRFAVAYALSFWILRSAALVLHWRIGGPVVRISSPLINIGVGVLVLVSAVIVCLGVIRGDPNEFAGGLMLLAGIPVMVAVGRPHMLAYFDLGIAIFCFVIFLRTYVIFVAAAAFLCMLFSGYLFGISREGRAFDT